MHPASGRSAPCSPTATRRPRSRSARGAGGRRTLGEEKVGLTSAVGRATAGVRCPCPGSRCRCCRRRRRSTRGRRRRSRSAWSARTVPGGSGEGTEFAGHPAVPGRGPAAPHQLAGLAAVRGAARGDRAGGAGHRRAAGGRRACRPRSVRGRRRRRQQPGRYRPGGGRRRRAPRPAGGPGVVAGHRGWTRTVVGYGAGQRHLRMLLGQLARIRVGGAPRSGARAAAFPASPAGPSSSCCRRCWRTRWAPPPRCWPGADSR